MNAALQQLAAAVRRSPLLACNIALLLILGVAYYFLLERHQTLTQQHAEVRRNGEAMMLSLTSQARISTQLATVRDALAYIDKNLIVESDLAENLNYFYQMESLSRVRLSQLNQLSSMPPPEGNPYKAIPFSLRATGTYAQLMHFLREMEAGQRLLRIKTFSFNRGDGKSGTLNLDLTVELLGSP